MRPAWARGRRERARPRALSLLQVGVRLRGWHPCLHGTADATVTARVCPYRVIRSMPFAGRRLVQRHTACEQLSS